MNWVDLVQAIDAAPYVVANNSAIAHLAASRARWILCLFAASHPYVEWMPRGSRVVTMLSDIPCSPCAIDKGPCPNAFKCMNELRPKEVFRLFNRMRTTGAPESAPRQPVDSSTTLPRSSRDRSGILKERRQVRIRGANASSAT
jgi:hypothetical protein